MYSGGSYFGLSSSSAPVAPSNACVAPRDRHTTAAKRAVSSMLTYVREI